MRVILGDVDFSFRRLRQARLQSLAYLDKEGFQWRCDDVFTDIVESAPFSDSFGSSAGKSISPFTFPTPVFSFTTSNTEDFLSPIPVKDLRSFCERHVSLGTRLPANPVGEDQAEVVSSLIIKEFTSFPTGLTDVVASSYRPDIITSMDSYHLNVVRMLLVEILSGRTYRNKHANCNNYCFAIDFAISMSYIIPSKHLLYPMQYSFNRYFRTNATG